MSITSDSAAADPASVDSAATDPVSSDSASADPVSSAAEIVARLHAALDELAALDPTGLSDTELVEVSEELERAGSRVPFVGDRLIVEASARVLPRKLGYRNVTAYMSQQLRIGEPGKRKRHLDATTHTQDLTGQPIEPQCPTLSDAMADGRLSPRHVGAVLDVIDRIPTAVEHDKRVAAEKTLSDLACDHTPAEIATLGQRLLSHLDPDGTLNDDTDRKRRRQLWLGKQRADGMSKLTAILTPTTRAYLDVLLDSWAAAGRNNPDDADSPTGAGAGTDADTLADAATRDGRTQAQRNHDALAAFLESAINNGEAGSNHRGLPIQLIIKVDEADLRRRTGLATTASGTLLPISDVINLAAEIEPHLAVFAEHRTVPMYFGTAKRCATRGQRLALFAGDDGEVCSTPGCDQPATRLEIHHARTDYADGGSTDITDLAGICPKHHRMIGKQAGQFHTTIADDGRALWHRNTAPGQPPDPGRVNQFPDIARIFVDNLADVREQIHGTRDTSSSNSPPTPGISLTDIRDAGLSIVEIETAARLHRHLAAA